MSDSEHKAERETARHSVLWLYGRLLRFLVVFNLVVVWSGHFYLYRTWPAPFKLWLCTVLGVVAIVDSLLRRGFSRRAVEPFGAKYVISPLESLGVVAIVVAEGAFLTWVAVGPPD